MGSRTRTLGQSSALWAFAKGLGVVFSLPVMSGVAPGPCFSWWKPREGTLGFTKPNWKITTLLSCLPQTLESVDVHCFGHLLYEMTYGRPPDSVPVDSFPPAPSMAVGQYGLWKSLMGPGSPQSYLPPFQSPGRTQRKLPCSIASQIQFIKVNQVWVIYLN